MSYKGLTPEQENSLLDNLEIYFDEIREKHKLPSWTEQDVIRIVNKVIKEK